MKCIAIAVGLLLVAVTSAWAGGATVPQLIAIQGKLERANHDGVTGTRAYRVRFWSEDLGGFQVGPDHIGVTELSAAGRFSISVTPTSATLDQQNLHYELAIDSAPAPDGAIDAADVFPTRVKVFSVPFALRAGDALALGGVGAAQFVTEGALTSQGTTAGGQTFWRLGGNEGASDENLHYLGNGSGPLQIRLGEDTVARFVRSDNSSNITMGIGNFSTDRAEGATVGGGADNGVNEDYGTVGGGQGNSVDDSDPATEGASAATIGGGTNNRATRARTTIGGGQSNTAAAESATIGGGYGNTAAGPNSVIAGGINNKTGNFNAVVGGGAGNSAAETNSTVSGGADNVTSGSFAAIPGGKLNAAKGEYSLAAGRRAKALHNGSFVWGDATDADFASTGANQFLIRAAGGVGIGAPAAAGIALGVAGTIGGNELQLAGSQVDLFEAAAPRFGQAASFNLGGGEAGAILESQLDESGGIFMNDDTLALWSPGDGGLGILRVFDEDNMADPDPLPAMKVEGGGFLGLNRGNLAFTIAHPLHVGTTSSNGNGAFLSASGTWTNASDVNKKEGFVAIDKQALLAKLAAIPVSQWKYIGDATGALHIGPTAQDFKGAFGVGEDEKYISTVDADGVALAAIQGLIDQNKAKEAEIEGLRRELRELKAAVAALAEKQN